MIINSSLSDYKAALDILANTTQHIQFVTDLAHQEILPKLKTPRSLIDVGAGAGVLTANLKDDFQKITVVEVNPELKDILSQFNYDVKIGDFFNLTINDLYDLVLCIHVMYHYNDIQSVEFIKRLLSVTQSKGFCLIVMMAPRGQNHYFHQEFNPNYVSSQMVLDILDREKIPYQKIAKKNHFTATNFDQMFNLLKFFAIEDCLTKPSNEITPSEMQKIDAIVQRQAEECKSRDKYIVEQEEDYIIISK